MKFKEIKPGMVIHCPKEEDARALCEYMDGLGYRRRDGGSPLKEPFRVGHYEIKRNRFDISITPDYGETITEFSDLIEPDENLANKANNLANSLDNQDNDLDNQQDNEMSAVEVLSWLKDNQYTGACEEIFNTRNAGYVIDTWNPNEIIGKITAYESTKKAPKPVEVEHGWHCEVFELHADGYSPKIHDSYDLWEGDEDNAMDDAVDKAIKHVEKTGKQTYAQVFATCRVKGE